MRLRSTASTSCFLPAACTLALAFSAWTAHVAAEPDAPTPPPPAADPQPSAASADSAKAEAALLAELDASQAPQIEELPLLRFYGFMDMGLQSAWGGLYKTGLSQSEALTFVPGNINLYMDANPAPQFHGLAEVRFTTFPNGTESLDPLTGQFTQHDTTVVDYTSPLGGFLNVQWGSIVLERAHIDWTPSDLFNLRVGYFLTPYGIWNVDHGTPTRIVLIPPVFMAYGFMPERQTGLMAYGTAHLLPWELSYNLYLTNGRAVAVDFTNDKAIGGRLVARIRRPVALQLGASFYTGNAQTVEKTLGTTDGMLGVVRNTTIEYNEIAGGGDISLDAGALRVRAEFVVNRMVYTPGKRASFAGVLKANATWHDGYLLLAYRLPWLGIEPLLFGELIHIPQPSVADWFFGVNGGVNVYITPSVIIRTQIGRAQGFNPGKGPKLKNSDINIFAARLVISF